MANVIKKYSNANLGWQYYKHYYSEKREHPDDILVNRNETILKTVFREESVSNFVLPNCKMIILKVVYPGLLIGSGYIHDAIFQEKNQKEESFKIGFSFDHVTGMPYMPGHSVKGALRAIFPNHKNEKYATQKTSIIMEYLEPNEMKKHFDDYIKKCGISDVKYSEDRLVRLLGNIIFEGEEPFIFEKGEFKYKQIPLHRRDIFHDGYLSMGGKDNLFLGTDYITHHANPLKNPNPVKFLKILPGVTIKFQFDLKDNLISAKQKENLFRKILLDFGIGAKTNVGYGQFRRE